MANPHVPLDLVAARHNRMVPAYCHLPPYAPYAAFSAPSYNPFCHKTRHKTTKEQLHVLEQYYAKEKRPDAKERDMLARRIQMSPRGVQIWFQNRRAKEKAVLNKKNAAATSTAGDGGSSSTSKTESKPENAMTEVSSVNSTTDSSAAPVNEQYRMPAPMGGSTAPSIEADITHHGYAVCEPPYQADAPYLWESDFKKVRQPYMRSRAMSLPSLYYGIPVEGFPAGVQPPSPTSAGLFVGDQDSYVNTGSAQYEELPAQSEEQGTHPGLTPHRYLWQRTPTMISDELLVRRADTRSDAIVHPLTHANDMSEAHLGGPMDAFHPDPSWSSLRRGSCPPEYLASFQQQMLSSPSQHHNLPRTISVDNMHPIEEGHPWEEMSAVDDEQPLCSPVELGETIDPSGHQTLTSTPMQSQLGYDLPYGVKLDRRRTHDSWTDGHDQQTPFLSVAMGRRGSVPINAHRRPMMDADMMMGRIAPSEGMHSGEHPEFYHVPAAAEYVDPLYISEDGLPGVISGATMLM
ncbi:uncharacterized protein EV422DRAFT_505751 [Fimicolochytrium jonesii]|uniref:uncharacterized protein n=1 Tax=Fimicolochytrium jonesii TaxID=1396493 RepID=UPI0022FE8DF5|nr:uncharacterized protein EV422DRAFT_505751 [Fimicolochytrium jonesii]KAI8821620.1 hypothetical protein EV422DRAFT_505751 [Fimicolochytrium jonesii]